MDAGDHQGELDGLLSMVAGDLSERRESIEVKARDDVEAAMFEAVLRIAPVIVSFDLMRP